MSRIFKSVSAVLLALILVMAIPVTAFAAGGSVTFDGSEKFSFDPGSSYSATDLFDDGFKNVMPGDKISETITISNKAKGYDYIKVYLRAEPHDSDNLPVSTEDDVATMEDFLAQLTLRVYNGDKLIFEASPDELDGLAENVHLGNIKKNKSMKLTVELDVPIDLGNEYANRVGEVDWVFTVEGHNIPTTPSSTPQTGDSFNLILLIGLMVLSAVGIVVLVITSKRNKKEK